MKLLLPLGLLGLLGIIVLIIIYIIRPNFQQKLISSTYIWKLSLKYRKRKLPISRLRNFLLILSQILIITACALILTKPSWILKEQVEEPEVVLIIDSSASMRAGSDETTRYERAVRGAIEKAEDTFNKNGIVSVMLAARDNSFLFERVTAEGRADAVNDLQALLDSENTNCSFGTCDLNAAVRQCDEILQANPSARIYLYTDTNYASVPENITLENVSAEGEWNGAILNATAELVDNYYVFTVEVASYGRAAELTVNLEIFGVNAEDSTEDNTITLQFSSEEVAGDYPLECDGVNTRTVIFKYFPDDDTSGDMSDADGAPILVPIDFDGTGIYSYQSVHVSLVEAGSDTLDDSLSTDNSFDIYGGLKEVLKVQYYSAGKDPNSGVEIGPNIFFEQMLETLRKNYADRWDIQITEVKKGNTYATTGYDFYIFEHDMPEEMPKDGFVFLVDPNIAPKGSDISLGGSVAYRSSVFLAAENSHVILNNVDPSNISVSRYTKLSYYDPEEYIPLMSYADDPLFLVKNQGQSRVAVMLFSVHYSNFPLLKDFPVMMNNLFSFFMPSTVVGNSFETYESVDLNCRGKELQVTGYKVDTTFEEFPATLSLNTPGTYKLTTTTYSDTTVIENIYVKVPATESNLYAEGDAIVSSYYEINESDYYNDLLLYFAIALVALLTAEWLLQHKENSI